VTAPVGFHVGLDRPPQAFGFRDYAPGHPEETIEGEARPREGFHLHEAAAPGGQWGRESIRLGL
jgi:hypothetical protein